MKYISLLHMDKILMQVNLSQSLIFYSIIPFC